MNHFASAALQALHAILSVGVEQHGLCHPPASPGGVLQHRAFQALGLVVSQRKSRPFWVSISPVPQSRDYKWQLYSRTASPVHAT